MTTTKKTIATIITCHNRKEKTLNCLTSLLNQDSISEVKLDIYLVDDGSSDGTGETVKEKFPQVNILKGDGTLYWNGGMRFAFFEAMKNDYDYYFWLNDDTYLTDNALKLLLEISTNRKEKNNIDVIVTGTIRDIDTGQVNYGGRVQKSKLQPLKFILLDNKTEPQPCDTFNGNVVLIPREVTKEIGNISLEYSRQHSGDIDYGLRAKYAGFESWVASGIIGECQSNTYKGTIFDKSLSLTDRIKQMKSPKGVPPAREWMVFTKRHGGILWPYYWFRTLIRVAFPFIYLFMRKPQ